MTVYEDASCGEMRNRFIAGIIHGGRGMVKVVNEDGTAKVMTWEEWRRECKLGKENNAGRAEAVRAA